jgi:predicted unusual protein kinase regulating ubiquinone biosynthesis (AarF/ABC1/UbiB family)
MARAPVSGKRRGFRFLRLFFSLVLSFFIQYVRARLSGRSYNFFEDAARNRQRAIKIREFALQLGGVPIKVGQFLSSRVDLLPSEYIEELALLQDEVPGVPFTEIRQAIERELGAPVEQLFRRLDSTPLAAASLGQVHRGVLPTGASVAVKVQRPGIRHIVEADLATLRWIVGWLHRYTPLKRRIDLPRILVEFEETLRLELDYVQEGHHAERIAIMFGGDPRIEVPRVHWSYSTARLLTLQYMPGTKVTDFAALERQGISRSAVAEILMQAYLKQVLEDGFFHADPHPGNIFVRPGPVIVLVDFGMVGQIAPQMRDNIRLVFLGVIRRDYDQVIIALKRLGFFSGEVDTAAVKRALVWTVENFIDLSFGELRDVDPRLVIDHLQDVLFAESFQIPANYAFLGRALGTLSGLCTALDPSFQFVTVAEPFARRLIAEETGVRGTLRLARREALTVARTAYRLPFLAESLFEHAEAGELNFRAQFREVVQAVDRLERAMRRIVHGLFVVGFLIAGTLVYTTHNVVASIVAFVVAFLFLVRIILPSYRRR